MVVVANKRSVMTLYSGASDLYSHQVRIVLTEKQVAVDIIETDLEHRPEHLLQINPYGTIPTLVDRDLVLYHANIILEYLDERFPHPPLLPVYPVARAKSRLMMFRIQQDWYDLARRLQQAGPTDAKLLRKQLVDSLTGIAPLFTGLPYFLSEEFSLVDCCMAPLLWRLTSWGIELPAQAKAIHAYAERLFKRPSFKASLTERERELQPA
jgi:stringent starvation protein A